METIELRTLLRPLFRWWWLIALATVIAAASSMIYTLLQPAVYESRTTLVVGSAMTNPNPTSNQIFLAQQLAETYAGLAQREPIQTATLAALGIEWLPFYTVQASANSPIIEIVVVDQDPIFARDVAAMLAQQLILQGPAGRSEHRREQFVDSQLERLQASIVETQDEIAQNQQELASLFSAREIANKENQIDALDKKLYTLQSNYAALLATTQQGAANALSILEPANLPLEPVSSQLLLNMVVAAVVGLALAAGGAYLIDFLDDSIKDGEDAQQLLGVPTLATVPELMAEEEHQKLVMLYTTPHPAAEAYRMLRTNLQFASVDRPLHLLLVTSPAPEDGKSLTAANLAAAYTRAGKRVILIDADLHRPSQQRFFRLRNNWGLTLGLFDNNMAIGHLLQETSIPGLQVMTTGPLPPNPAELLGSRRMQEILLELREQADVLIIDSPPISAVSDALILTSQADGVLLVVKSGKTSRTLARKALNTLRQVKASVIGTVYNGVAEYDSDYTYDYTYTYYDTEPQESAAAAYSNGHVTGNGHVQHNGHSNGYTNGHQNGHQNGHHSGEQSDEKGSDIAEYSGAARAAHALHEHDYTESERDHSPNFQHARSQVSRPADQFGSTHHSQSSLREDAEQ
ncbi:MAG: polysaccharide biosynthesis tyrosine autokinase, partial [Caldilineaceae bacterium]|nr:polysaccharide biosynthesis tyrosine autokinase [Caldilineaceae bacterium]